MTKAEADSSVLAWAAPRMGLGGAAGCVQRAREGGRETPDGGRIRNSCLDLGIGELGVEGLITLLISWSFSRLNPLNTLERQSLCS